MLHLVIFALTSAELLSTVDAQGFMPGGRYQAQVYTRVPPPREVDRLIAQAKQAITAEQWSEATKALGIVLGLEQRTANVEGSGQDFFLEDELSKVTARQSIHQVAYQLFDSIPAKGQETVELRYGLQASGEIKEVIKQGDWQELEQLASKYRMTKIGRQASYLCAEHMLAQGNPEIAAWRFSSLLDSPLAREELGVESLVSATAQSWLAAEEQENARQLLVQAKSDWGLAAITIGDQAIDLSKPEQVLGKFQDLPVTKQEFKISAPQIVGGNPARNADSNAGLPLQIVSWHSYLHESQVFESFTLRTIAEQTKRSQSVSLIPSRTGIVVPPYVIGMTYDQRIHGINLKTGQLKWVPPFTASMHSPESRYGYETDPAQYSMPDFLAERIWGQQTTGQLSADSQNIYAIVEQSAVDVVRSMRRGINANIAIPRAPDQHNVLQAYSISADAKLRWEVGGENGLNEPKLANVLFLGAPLSYQGELLIIGEINGELVLFSIDPNKGTLLWQQQLCANPMSTIASDQIRRNFSSSPAVRSGIIVCPTISSELVAVDLFSHSLLWSVQYAQSTEARSESNVNAWGIAQEREFKPMAPRSSESSVLIDDGVVVHAPPDGEEIYAVDLRTGNRLWAKNWRTALYLGGATDGNVFIASDQWVRSVRLRSGEESWECDLSQFGRICGRSARNGSQLFVPTTDKKIVQIDSRDGSIAATTDVEMTLGNLIPTSDSLISFGPTVIASYPIRDEVRSQLREQLIEDPNDPLRLSRLAQLSLSEGKWEESFQQAYQAYQLAPNNNDIKSVARKISLNVLEQDFSVFETYLDKIGELMKDGPDRDVYLQNLVRALLKQESYDAAASNLLELITLRLEQARISQNNTDLQLSHFWSINRETWIAVSLADTLPKTTSQVREKLQRQIHELCDSALISYERAQLADQYFRFVPSTAEYYLIRGLLQLRSKNFLLAESHILICQRLAQRLDDQRLGENLRKACSHLYASLLHRVGRNEIAVQTAIDSMLPLDQINDITEQQIIGIAGQTLKNFDPSEVTADDESSLENTTIEWMPKATSVVLDDDQLKTLAENVDAGWPLGKPNVRIADVDLNSNALGTMEYRVEGRSGPSLRGWTLNVSTSNVELIDSTNTGHVTLYPSANGRLTDMYGLLMDSVVVLQHSGELIAIDSLAAQLRTQERFTDRLRLDSPSEILWQQRFGQENPGLRRTRSESNTPWGTEETQRPEGFTTAVADEYGLIVCRRDQVACVDPLTGQINWTVNTAKMDSSASDAKAIEQLPFVTYREGVVYLIDSVSGKCLQLRAADGEVVRVDTRGINGQIWFTHQGRIVTATKTAANKLEFTSIDARTGDVKMQLLTPASSRATRIGTDRLAVWGPEQQLVFWRLDDDQQFAYEILTDVRINELRVYEFADSLLLSTYSPFVKRRYVSNESEEEFRHVSGPMIAISQQTGKPLWSSPLTVIDYWMPLSQPRNSPTLTLIRQVDLQQENRQSISSAALTLVDLRTGQPLYENNYLKVVIGTTFVQTSSPEKQQFEITYRGSTITVDWQESDAIETAAVTTVGDISEESLLEQMPEEFKESNAFNSDDDFPF